MLSFRTKLYSQKRAHKLLRGTFVFVFIFMWVYSGSPYPVFDGGEGTFGITNNIKTAYATTLPALIPGAGTIGGSGDSLDNSSIENETTPTGDLCNTVVCADSIDDTVSGQNGDTDFNNNVPAADASWTQFYELTDMPDNFSSMDAGVQVDVVQSDLGNQTGNEWVILYAQIFESDNSTPLTAEVEICGYGAGSTACTSSGSYATISQTLTISGTNDKDTWDNAVLGLRWLYERDKGAENLEIKVTAVEITGDYTPLSTDFSGTAYSVEGSEPLTSKTVKVLKNNSTVLGTPTTNGSGVWSLADVSVVSGDIITVFLDGVTEKAVTVMVTDNFTQSNIDLYQNRLIVRDDVGSGITNANLLTGDDGDTDIFYSVSGNDLSVEAGKELHIWTGDTFTPGGAVTLHGNQQAGVDGDLHIGSSATYTQGATTTLAGSWFASSTSIFTPGVYETIFNATTTGKVIEGELVGDSAFASTSFNGSGGGWAFSNNASTTHLTIGAGTVTAPSGLLSIGGKFSNSGTFTHSGGSIYFNREWAQIGGDGLNSSWPSSGSLLVNSLVVIDGNVYAGVQPSSGGGEVWERQNGSTEWQQIGGAGLNSSWDSTHENVYSMTATTSGGNVYAGLGNGTGDAEVWRWNGSTWTKIGGDGLNTSWNDGQTIVFSMTSSGNSVYAGVGDGAAAGDGEVWEWNGSSWTKIGGDGVNSSWADSIYEGVYSLTVDGSDLYAGLGQGIADAELWKYSGATWTQIGGDGQDSSWGTGYNDVSAIAISNGNVYAGLGVGANDGDVWELQSGSTTWRQIGGDSLFSSWGTAHDDVNAMVAIYGNIYAALGNSAGESEVWKYNGEIWTKIGGDAINSSWADSVYDAVYSMVASNGDIYAGLGATDGEAEVWILPESDISGTVQFNNVFVNNNIRFTGNASTTDLTIATEGTVNAPSGLLSIAGDYTNNGTFTHNSGTTTFNGTSAQILSGTLDSASSFNNIEFIENGTKTISNDIGVAGNYTQSSTVSFAETAATTFNGASSQTIGGTLTDTSAFKNVSFEGAGAKTFSANTASTTNFTIDASSGTVTAPSTLLSIGGDYTNSGTFTNNGGTVLFDASSTYSSLYAAGIDVDGSSTGTGIEDILSIAISGNYAYIGKGANGTACSQTAGSAIGCEFVVFDVTDPDNPIYVAGRDVKGDSTGTGSLNVHSIAISGNYAYIGKGANTTACSQTAGSALGCEFMVFDITTPTNPTYVAGLDVKGNSTGTGIEVINSIAISGNYAYIGKSGDGTACSQTAGSAIGCEFMVFDITTPTSPTYVAGRDSSGDSTGVGSGIINSIAVSGNYVYVGKSASGAACSQTVGSAGGCEFMVFDVTTPTDPTYVAGRDANGSSTGNTNTASINSIAASGNYVYVGKGAYAGACSQTVGSALGCEFMVFDVTTPTNPTYVAGMDVDGSSTGTGNEAVLSIAISGNYAYIGKGDDNTACSQTAGSALGCEFMVFDITTPTSPTYVAGRDSSGDSTGVGSGVIRSIAASFDKAFIGKNADSTACSQTAGSATGCEFMVFSANQFLSGTMVDTSAFNYTTFTGGIRKTFNANASITDFMIDSTSGAVTAPADLLSISGDYTNNGTFTHNSGTVFASSTSAQTFAGTMTGTSALNNITFSGAGTKTFGDNAASTTDFTIDASSGDVTAPSTLLSIKGNYTNNGTFSNNGGTVEFDASFADALLYAAGIDASGDSTGTGNEVVNSIAISGNYAYVGKNNDPTACSQTPGSAIGCEFMVFDITTPTSPTYVAGRDVSGDSTGTGSITVYSVAVSGSYAYVGKGSNATACSDTPGSAIGCEFMVFDITDPENPVYVAGMDTDGSSAGTGTGIVLSVTVSEGYAYVGKNANATACSDTPGSAIGCEFMVFDITTPTNPTYVAGRDSNGDSTGTGIEAVYSTAISGNYAYVVTSGDATACSDTPGSAIGCEFMVFDITTPTNPTYVAGRDVKGDSTGTGNVHTYSIAISGNYAYIGKVGNATACSDTPGSALGCEFMVFDITTPTSPTYVAGRDVSGDSTGTGSLDVNSIAVSGSYAYIGKNAKNTACSQTPGSAIGCEFMVFDITIPTSPTYVAGRDASGDSTGTGAVSVESVAIFGNYTYIGKAGNATACSQTAGSARGCEFMVFSADQLLSGVMTDTSAFNDTVFTDSAGKTFNANASTTDFIIDSDATIVAPADRLSISGNYTNNGTFTHNSGTTTFNGTSVQTISGVATGTSAFYNIEVTNSSATTTFATAASSTGTFKIATPNAQIEFAGNATSSFNNIYFEGSSGNLVKLGTSISDTPWGMNVSGVQEKVSYVDVAYSNACSSNPNINANDGTSVDSGGVFCWDFSAPSTVLTISGTLYSDEGVTEDTGGSDVIHVRVATSTPGVFSTTTDSGSGAWKIDTILKTDMDPGVSIVVWVDNDSAKRASVFTKANHTSNDITGLDLYKDRVIIRHEGTQGTSTLLADLDFYDADNDTDIQYEVTGSALGVNAGQELHIWPGTEFAPEGAVILHGNAVASPDGDLHLARSATSSILTLGGNLTIAGSYFASSTTIFTPGSNTTTFNASTTGKNIFASTTPLGNVVFNEDASSGGWTLQQSASTTDLTITAGTVTAPTLLSIAGDYSNAGTFTHNSGTTYLTGSSKTYSGTMTDTSTFNDVVLTGSGLKIFSSQASTSAFTIENSAQFAGNALFSVSGNYTNNATFSHTGTMLFDGTSAQTLSGTMDTTTTDFGVVEFLGAGAKTFNANASTTNFTIDSTAGVVTAPSDRLSISGNYTNNGTFNSNNGTVTFNGTASQTLSGTLTSDGTNNSAFYNIEITNNTSEATTTFASVASTTNNFTVTALGARVEFTAGATSTLVNLIITGSSGNEIYLHSATEDTQWNIHSTGTRAVTYANIKDSNACSSAGDITVYDGTSINEGNNNCWTFTAPAPTLTQRAYVFRNDDGAGGGGLASTTAQEATSTPRTSVIQGERIIVAFQLDNTGNATSSIPLGIQYDKNDGVWRDLGTTTDSEIHFASSLTGAKTSRNNFWQPIATSTGAVVNNECFSSGNFIGGRLVSGTASTTPMDIGANDCAELAFAIHTGSSTLGQIYNFRLVNASTGAVLDAYTETPQITIESARNIRFSKQSFGTTTSLAIPYSSNIIGYYTSLAIGADGYPVIASKDFTATPNQIIITKCADTSCSSYANEAVTYSSNNIGGYNSLAIGTDGYPVIASQDTTADPDQIIVTKCGNISCSIYTNEVVTYSSNNIGSYNSLAIGTDGYPVIASQDTTASPKQIIVTKCLDTSCSSYTNEVVTYSSNNIGSFLSLAIGTDGYPVIASQDRTASPRQIIITKCADASCSSYTNEVVTYSSNIIGDYASLAIGTDGYPVIASQDQAASPLQIIITKCADASCSSYTNEVVTYSSNNIGRHNSLAIGADGYPVIASKDITASPRQIIITKCADASCSSYTNEVVTYSSNNIGDYASLAIGNDGYPVIASQDLTADPDQIIITKCNSFDCSGAETSVNANIPTDVATDLDFYLDKAGYTAATSSDDVYDSHSAASSTIAFQFVTAHANNTDDVTPEWEGQASGESQDLTLEIYRFGATNAWENVATKVGPTVDTDYYLASQITTNLSDYYNGAPGGIYEIYTRVTMATTTGIGTLRTDSASTTFATPSAAPTYGGTLYTNEGVTNAGAGKTVALSINGAASQTDATDGSGVWSITLSSAPSVGNTITAWVDGDESFKAVTISNASTTDENMDDFDLYQDRVIVRDEVTQAGGQGTTITNADIAVCDSSCDGDIPFTVTGGALNIATSSELHIWRGTEFAPGGNVTIHGNAGLGAPVDGDFHLETANGTSSILTLGTTDTFTLAGSYFASSTSILNNSGALIFGATTTGKIIVGELIGDSALASTTFEGLNGTGGAWSFNDPDGGAQQASTTNLLIKAGGTLTAPASGLLSVSGDYTNNGNFTSNGATVLIDGGSAQTLDGTMDLPATDFGDVLFSGAGTKTFNANASTTDFTIINGATVVAPSGGLLSIAGDYTNNGDFTDNNSTVLFDGAGAQTLAGEMTDTADNFVNVQFMGGGTKTFSTNASTSAFTIQSGVEVVAPTLLTISFGNYTNNGTFTHSGGTIFFTTDGPNNLTGTMTGNSAFNNIEFLLNTGTWTFSDNASTTDFTVNSGASVNVSSRLITVLGDFTFSGNLYTTDSSSKLYIASTTANQTLSGTMDTTFNDLGAIEFLGATTKTFNANASTTDFIIGTGATVVAPSGGLLSVAGDYTNNGTYSSSTAAILFDGTSGTQTIDGTLTGTGSAGAGSELGNVEFWGGAAKTFNASASTTNFTIISGSGAVTAPSGLLSIAGNYTNNGTFDNNNGTTTFNGTGVQTVSGNLINASAFYNIEITNSSATTTFATAASSTGTFKIATPNAQVEFAGNATSSFNNIYFEGSSGNLIKLGTSISEAQWGMDVSGVQEKVSYVDVAYSNACSGNPDIDASDGTNVNSGGVFCWTFPSAAPTYSGTLYTNEGVTNAGAGKTVAISINGAASQTDATDGSGVWSITLSSAPSVGNTITAWVDGDESFKAVTISNASTTDENMDDFDLYQDRVIVRDEVTQAGGQGTTITNADIAVCDSSCDSDIPFTVTGGALHIATSSELHIWRGTEFKPGGNVTIHGNAGLGAPVDGDFHLETANGTSSILTLGASDTLTLGGSWFASSSVIVNNTNLITFSATTTGKRILGSLSGSSSFGNVTFGGVGGSWTFNDGDAGAQNASTTDLIITNGTVIAPSSGLLTIGGDYTNNGTFTHNSGTTTFTGSSVTFSGAMNDTSAFNDVILTGSGLKTFSAQASTSAFTIENNAQFAGSQLFSISGDYNIDSTATFSHTSTILFDGASAQTLSGTMDTTTTDFGPILFSGGGTKTFAANASTTDFTIISGATVVAPSSGSKLLSISGDYTNSGTFTDSNGTVLFDGTTQSLAGTMNTATNDFNSVVFSGAGTKTFNANATTSKFTIQSGATVVAPTMLTIKGAAILVTNSGTFTHNSGTVYFDDTFDGITIVGNWIGDSAFNNIEITNCISGCVTFNTNASTTDFTMSHSSAGTEVNISNRLITISGNFTNTNSGYFVTNASSRIYIASTTANQTLSGTMDTAATDLGAIEFLGATTKTFNANASTTDFIIGTGATVVAPSGGLLSISGDYTNNGTYSSSTAAILFDGTSGTQTIDGTLTGTGVAGAGSELGNVEFSKGAAKTFNASASTTNFTIISGSGAVTAPSGLLSISGDYTNSGTFTSNSGTVLLDGAAQQTLSGDMTETGGTLSSFANLEIRNTIGEGGGGSPAQSIIFANSASTTATFTMIASTSAQFLAGATSTFQNINFTGTIDQYVWLRSSSGGSEWGLNVPGTQTAVNYVDVADSNACSGNPNITADSNSVDSNGNSCWDFTVASLEIASAGNQVFKFGQGATSISAITVTDSSPGSITSTNNLRIAIATSSMDMRWDTTDTSAVTSGTAVDNSRIANPATVSYEGDGSVLVIPVASNFAAVEAVTISGLSFKSFNGANSAVSALDVFKDGPTDQVSDADDTRTIAIKGTLAFGGHSAGQEKNQFTTNTTAVSQRELFRFSLTPTGEGVSISNLTFNLTGVSGFSAGHITNATTTIDYDGDGFIDTAEVESVLDSPLVSISGDTGTITFDTGASSAFIATTTRDYILRADIASINPNDNLTFSLDSANDFTASGITSSETITATGQSVVSRHLRTVGRGGATVDAPVAESLFNSPTSTGADLNGPGNSAQWTDGYLASTTDDQYATETTTGEAQDYGGFGFFSIPASNTISGIEVHIEGKRSGGGTGDIDVALSYDGGTTYTSAKTIVSLTSSDQTKTLGNESDLWGRSTWTPTEVNNDNFRLRITSQNVGGATLSVDLIEVRVHHASTGGGGGGGEEIGSELGFKSPTANSNPANFDINWTSPDNGVASDNSYATITSGATAEGATDYTNFGFSIPNSNQIDGIAVRLEVSGDSQAGEVAVELSWNNGVGTTTVATSTGTLSTTDRVVTLGHESYLWGRVWDPDTEGADEFSNTNFRVRVIGRPSINTVQLDALQVKIYHSAVGGGGGGGGDVLAPMRRNLASALESLNGVLEQLKELIFSKKYPEYRNNNFSNETLGMLNFFPF